MVRLSVIAVATGFSLMFASAAEAQFVRVGGFGGVRVRAPGVAVSVGPYGYRGAYVRAPYTRVYRPFYPYPRAVVGVPFFPPIPPVAVVPPIAVVPPVVVAPPVAVVPAVPAYEVQVAPTVVYTEPAIPADGYKVTRPSLDGYVSEDLRKAAMRFQANLSVRSDSDVWLNYLNPGRIIASVDGGEDPAKLKDLLRNYNGVVANSSLRAIYNMPGFNETRELLGVYVDTPPKRSAPAPQALRPPSAAPQPAPAPQSSGQDLPAPIPAPAPDANGAGQPGNVPAPPAADPPGADSAATPPRSSEKLIDL